MKRLFVMVIVTLLMGCVKETIHTDYASPTRSLNSPTITLTSPQDFQQFTPGQTVTITAKIADDDQLEKVRLLVTRSPGVQVLLLEKYLDVKSYNLSESFTPEAGPRYSIKIEAVDRNNNNTKTQIQVSCN